MQLMSRKMMFVSSQRNAGGSTPRQGNINIHVVIAADDADVRRYTISTAGVQENNAWNRCKLIRNPPDSWKKQR
jgi:hypothetical protein